MSDARAERLDASFVAEFADRWWEARNDSEAIAMRDLCVPDVTWDDPQLRATATGFEPVHELVHWLFRAFPDAVFTPEAPPYLCADGLSALVCWRLRATHSGPMDPPGFPPTGRTLELAGLDRWEFRDRLLSRCTTVYDSLSLARQLGNLPPPGHPLERLSAYGKRARHRVRHPLGGTGG